MTQSILSTKHLLRDYLDNKTYSEIMDSMLFHSSTTDEEKQIIRDFVADLFDLTVIDVLEYRAKINYHCPGDDEKEVLSFLICHRFGVTRSGKILVSCMSASNMVSEIWDFIYPIIKHQRWDMLERITFSMACVIDFVPILGIVGAYKREYGYFGFSVTNYTNPKTSTFHNQRVVELAKLLHFIYRQCSDATIIEYLDRYGTLDMKKYFAKYFDELGINLTKDRPELRMYLMRFVQGVQDKDDEMNVSDAFEKWRL